jgi:hypothetical protein
VKKIIALLCFIFMFSVPVFAQNLEVKTDVKVVDYSSQFSQNLAGRFGAGVEYLGYQGFGGISEMPAVTIRYWIDNNVSAEAVLGFGTGKYYDRFYVGAKFLAIIQNYKTINLYATVLGGGGYEIDNRTSPKVSAQIFKFGTGLGVEWFVVDRISLSMEAGFEWLFNDVADVGNTFGIYGDFVNRAGVRFYI